MRRRNAFPLLVSCNVARDASMTAPLMRPKIKSRDHVLLCWLLLKSMSCSAAGGDLLSAMFMRCRFGDHCGWRDQFM